MMPKRKVPVVGLILAGLLCVSAAFAGENISHSSWESTAPRAAFDSAGNLYVVWAEFYGNEGGDLFFAKYTQNTQTWSTPFNVSNSGRVWSDTFEVGGIAVDDADRVWIVWTERSVVRLRTLAGSQWDQAGNVGSGTTLQGAKVAAIGQGNCYIVWWGNDGVVRSRARVNQVWENARIISVPGRRSKFCDVAAGNNWVMATWVEKSGSSYQAAYVLRFRPFGSTWSSSKLVYRQSISQQHAVVEFLNSVTPQIVFTPLTDPARYVAHAAWNGEGFSTPRKISSELMLHYPSLATVNDRMIAIWQVGAFGNGRGIYYNEYSDGGWKGETAVPSSAGGTYCDVAIHSEGSVGIVWDSGGEIMAKITGGETPPPPPNIEPVAVFSFLPATGSAPLTVSFDASASYDPDGTIARYDWLFGDGNAALGKTVTHRFATPGTYRNTLTVVDNLGLTNSTAHSIEVINLVPTADFSFLPATGSAPLTVNFDASASSDPDGSITQYSWTFGDGTGAAGKTVTHKFATPGTYTNKLTVVDNFGKTSSKSKSINVINLAPVPGFTITPPSGIVPVTMVFDAGSAYDPDGSIVQYDWVFGDGVTAQGKSFSRAYSLPGTFSINLTITDNFFKKASLTKTFTLLALQAPLNIRWESFTDASLFQSRVVTDVQWEANPANDAIATIVKYRVFRKGATDAVAAYQLTAETDGLTFFWRDDDVTVAGQYVYTITSMDAAGHESLMPSQSSAANSQNMRSSRRSRGRGSSFIQR